MPTVRARIETAKLAPDLKASSSNHESAAPSPAKKAKIEKVEASMPLDVRLGLTTEKLHSAPLRWGIIGASSISSDWSKCLQEIPGSVLHAVAARSAEKAEKFRSEHQFAKCHTTYAELCDDPEVDVVYIGTITKLHKEHSLLALRARKHVLCEKPLAENAADAAEMYAAAEEAGVALIEGMWSRYFPAMEHARHQIEQGAIGKVKQVHADFPDRCYAVQAAPFAFGSSIAPTEILASGDANGVGAALVRFAAGSATLSFPDWKSEFAEVVEITGSKGRMTLDLWGHAPTRLTIRKSPAVCWDEPQGHTSTSQNGIEPHTETFCYPVPEPAGYPAAGWHYSNQRGFVYQAAAVHRCLVAGLRECPQYTREDSMTVMRILEEVNKQME